MDSTSTKLFVQVVVFLGGKLGHRYARDVVCCGGFNVAGCRGGLASVVEGK